MIASTVERGDMAEAGRKQGRTNFAVTCTLLSQYIKEKGSIADLGLGIAQDAAIGKSESVRPPTTMSVIPGADLCRGEDGAMELFPQSVDLDPAVLEDARINARSPYQVSASPEMGINREDNKSWLGLGPRFSIPSLSPSSEYNR
ncbi:hypothetical protein C4D60_Mb11t08390 [Musa balbisiana]|uniref:Uncharacterized protein n=1 Tax=Musa balbisiana TaxID=52838 RepID=A0A4S8J2M4_MUSBA|nr:hypothetical protein C4D60_Mb11t08390 [Musa balbisiana]